MYISKIKENIYSHKNLYTGVHSSINHNNKSGRNQNAIK